MALLREESRSPLFADPHPDAEARTFRITTAQLMDGEQVFLLATSGGEIVGAYNDSGTPSKTGSTSIASAVDPSYRCRRR